ncbi:ABC transporter substrate-binding protein [Rubrobacter indicoceani]|uniref:ABC transporter substrate-binding protein n=1 Tax=Rubrobacter indicoceani TaxID=2051957 RepID=UPI0013C4019D|nr:ABC transporter substrate-binding protein [Rubrobacter indicoceani]
MKTTERPGFTIPEIKDLTRRDFLFGGAAALLLGGCGGGEAEESPGQTRTIEHSMGTTPVPVSPQRIITVTDQNALLPLLELGITPIASAGSLEGDEGVFRRTDGFDTSDVEFVGDFLEPNLEAIASLEPDLIVGYEFQEDLYERLADIAPTVFIQVFDRPLDEALMDFADLVNRTDRAEELRSRYKDRVATLLEDLREQRETLSVSVISPGDAAGQFYRADVGQALGTVMEDLSLPRPAPQQGVGDFDPFSLENLSEHDADVVLVVDYSEESAEVENELVESPLYRSLAAYEADQAYTLDGTETVGAAWVRMEAFLDELERILLDPGLDPDTVQE